MSQFTIRLEDGPEIGCAGGQNILEACLTAGVPMPYNCRSGECAECRAVLVDGSVEESPGADPAVFTDADRDRGRILTCLCAPTSDITLRVALRDGAAAPKIERVNALVEQVTPVSASVVQVVLETPWEIAYRAGQYFEWGLPGIAPNRYFSAASRPGDARLVFDVRLYPGGKVSDYVRSVLRPGEAIEVAGPFGHFGFTANDHRPAVCVAGGTGLAPIKAMLEDAFATGGGRQIELFYGARAAGDLYDIDLLERWAGEHPGFRYHIALSDEPDGTEWSGHRGLVTDLVRDNLFDGFGLEAYLCGPPPMIDATIPVLEDIGVEAHDIHADRFSPAKQAAG